MEKLIIAVTCTLVVSSAFNLEKVLSMEGLITALSCLLAVSVVLNIKQCILHHISMEKQKDLLNHMKMWSYNNAPKYMSGYDCIKRIQNLFLTKFDDEVDRFEEENNRKDKRV